METVVFFSKRPQVPRMESGVCRAPGVGRIFLFLALLLISPMSKAALVSSDYVTGSGDNLITRDIGTGLDWLDLSLTYEVSVEDVLNDYGGYISAGFRLATVGEVASLWNSAGIPFAGFTYGPDYYTEAANLETLLIGNNNVVEFVRGYYDSGVGFADTVSRADLQINHRIGEVQGFISTSNTWPVDIVANEYASYLVKSSSVVPLPPTAWLLASALGVFGYLGKRKANT